MGLKKVSNFKFQVPSFKIQISERALKYINKHSLYCMRLTHKDIENYFFFVYLRPEQRTLLFVYANKRI